MSKHQVATNLFTRLYLMFVLFAHLLDTARALSDKRLCADEHCKEIISLGVGVITYTAAEEGMVSFKINSPMRIKSKGAGSNPLIWGVEVNGREGYAPKNYIRETKVFVSEKNLKFEVDVKPKTKSPDLSTSEKLVEQGSTSEATTTKPLNLTPAASSEDLNKVPNEKISEENLPVATPVLSEVVDGTKVPVLEDKVQNSSNNAGVQEKDVQATVEAEVKPEIKESVPEEYKIDNGTTETSKQLIRKDGQNISEEMKQNENTKAKQENEVIVNKTYSENSLETKTNISELIGDSKKDIQVEAKKQKESIILESSHVVSGSPVGNYTLVDENTYTSLDNATNLVTEIPVGEYNSANQNTLNVDDVAAEESQNDIGDNRQSNSENEKTTGNKDKLQNNAVLNDSQEEKDKAELNSIYESPEVEKNSSVIVSKPELQSNNVVNQNDDFTKSEVEMELTNEATEPKKLIPEKQEQTHQTFIEYPILPLQSLNETVANSANVSSVEKTESFDKELKQTNSVVSESTTSSSESKAELNSNERQKENESETIEKTSVLQGATEKIITDDYLTETVLNIDDNKINTNEVDQQLAPHHVLENSKTDDTANIQTHVGALSYSSIENSNSINIHNQHEINNEAYEEVPLQQRNEDTVKLTDNTNSLPTESLPLYMEPTKFESVKTEVVAESSIHEAEQIHEASNSTLNTAETSLNTIYQTSDEIQSKTGVVENINPTTSNPIVDVSLNTPLPTYQEDISTIVPQTDNHGLNYETIQEKLTKDSVTTTIANVPDDQPDKNKDEDVKVAPPLDILETKENKGLFATIMGTVNNMLTDNRKNKNNRILFSQGSDQKNNIEKPNEDTTFAYCTNIGPNGECPESSENHDGHSTTSHFDHTATKFLFGSDLTMETFLTTMASKILEMSELLVFLGIAAAASLFFIFGYYCFCNSSREGTLLLKLNQLESSLLASHKENAILKHNLMSTRQKLASIEDNSFGSNDMVVSLKKELEEELLEKARLQEQITVLQKELENAADAGIELNKIVSELLSNQTGDESIISSVEDLQRQLNEQQNTIYEINASLAEKSRENSELQLMIAEQNARYEAELVNVQRDNDELEHEKGNLLTRLEEMKTDFDKDITVALEGKNMEIKRLQNDILDLNNQLENEHTKWQTSVAKIEALEECLKNVRKDPKVNINEVIDVVNVKAQLIEAQKMYKSLKERFETDLDSRKLVENQLEIVSTEVEKLKQDFNQSEKDKLEAQTRLEVLSNYFKDKENQLQKELSLKEAMWLKQQGETTTTVDRVTAMQEEIQSLKSQNDSLRAEIEAQLAAHKAQIGTLENRAHETWLAARQSDRRYEEARVESTALRRKLTALAGGNINETNKTSGDELRQAPSPIHMESPGSPMLGRMPPPPPFLPPPFMGPPPPFIGMPPPPPFVPPGEMRPAPLGRIMSPPPQRSGHFSPQHLDYEDYMEYEANNTWHRYPYSPPPRTYRSLSPTDSRYNYGTERDLISTYDTETDFSPPPSPREPRRRVGNSSERIDGNTKISYGNTNKFNSSNKGPLSSGSENSFNNHSHNDTKTKKGNATVGGKNLV